MSELAPTASENKPSTADAARIELAGMAKVGHGFGMSVEGMSTGGVFVNKEASANIGGSYVHEEEALRALAAERTPQELEGIRKSLGSEAARRLVVDALPGAQRSNDRRVGVTVGGDRVGGGAKFIGNQEIRLPNGGYINEADLKAAIEALQDVVAGAAEDNEAVVTETPEEPASEEPATAPLETMPLAAALSEVRVGRVAQTEADSIQPPTSAPEQDAAPEKKRLKRRIGKGLAAAAALLAVMGGAYVSQGETPDRSREVAAVASVDTAANPDILPPEQFEEVVEPEVEVTPEIEKNWMITDGMGGEALFDQLSVDPAKWYEMQDTLIDQYPDYFYRSDAGDVRFAYPGVVPKDIQHTIESMF